MALLDMNEVASMKLLIIKDLEKTLKIVYEHQYRNILSKIVSHKKRFTKKSLPMDASEDICRYDSLAAGLTSYLVNLFDVFGESAVLNAKKTFEENGTKWGKKLERKLSVRKDISGTGDVIRCLYINVPEIDYIEISGDDLVWHLSKQGHNGINGGFSKFHTKFYDIKAAWLHSFIKAFIPQYTSIFEKKSEDDKEIVTQIELKDGTV